MRKNTLAVSLVVVFVSLCPLLLAQADHRRGNEATGTPVAPTTDPKTLVAALQTDHVKNVTCAVDYDKGFTYYALHYVVRYTDGKPDYSVAIEVAPHDDELWDECKSFMYSLLSQQIEDTIAEGRAKVKKAREDHFFLDAKKYAKK